MERKLIVSPSPHIHGRENTSRIMLDVLIALFPAFVVSVLVYGIGSLIVTATAVAACVLFEMLIERFLLKRKNTIGDCSAMLTGVLLAFNLPNDIPVWMVMLGSLVAIGVGKMSFGGLGRNLFNPALVGRVFLLISFPVYMTNFTPPVNVQPLVEATVGPAIAEAAADAASGPTLLGYVKAALAGGQTTAELETQFDYMDMLFGFRSGSLGEIAALALLLGLAYLLIRKVITWHIPIAVLGSMMLFSGTMWMIDPDHYMNPLFHVLSGGALLGAIFMATDYVTSPMTRKGMIIYGVGIGVITMLIRIWGAYPEGMSFAILIMNATVPLINKYVKPRRFGRVEPAKG